MAVVANIPSNTPDSGGIASKLPPTPILLVMIGGGVGLAVLLLRKAGGGNSTAQAADSTLLPNTAIMLGSLQQGVLDLKGEVGADYAAQGLKLADLQGSQTLGFTTLGAQYDANTKTITDSMKTQGDALAKLVSDAATANAAGIVQIQTDQVAQHNAEMGVLNGLWPAIQGGMAGLNSNWTAYYHDLVDRLAGVATAQTTLGNAINAIPTPTAPSTLSAYEGRLFRGNNGADPHSLTYIVQGGKLYGIGSYATFLNLAGVSGPIDTAILQQQGKYTTIANSDAQLQTEMVGILP